MAANWAQPAGYLASGPPAQVPDAFRGLSPDQVLQQIVSEANRILPTVEHMSTGAPGPVTMPVNQSAPGHAASVTPRFQVSYQCPVQPSWQSQAPTGFRPPQGAPAGFNPGRRHSGGPLMPALPSPDQVRAVASRRSAMLPDDVITGSEPQAAFSTAPNDTDTLHASVNDVTAANISSATAPAKSLDGVSSSVSVAPRKMSGGIPAFVPRKLSDGMPVACSYPVAVSATTATSAVASAAIAPRKMSDGIPNSAPRKMSDGMPGLAVTTRATGLQAASQTTPDGFPVSATTFPPGSTLVSTPPRKLSDGVPVFAARKMSDGVPVSAHNVAAATVPGSTAPRQLSHGCETIQAFTAGAFAQAPMPSAERRASPTFGSALQTVEAFTADCRAPAPAAPTEDKNCATNMGDFRRDSSGRWQPQNSSGAKKTQQEHSATAQSGLQSISDFTTSMSALTECADTFVPASDASIRQVGMTGTAAPPRAHVLSSVSVSNVPSISIKAGAIPTLALGTSNQQHDEGLFQQADLKKAKDPSKLAVLEQEIERLRAMTPRQIGDVEVYERELQGLRQQLADAQEQIKGFQQQGLRLTPRLRLDTSGNMDLTQARPGGWQDLPESQRPRRPSKDSEISEMHDQDLTEFLDLTDQRD